MLQVVLCIEASVFARYIWEPGFHAYSIGQRGEQNVILFMYLNKEASANQLIKSSIWDLDKGA